MPEKLDAIVLGDVSGRNVHPVFIHIAHLLGCVFCRVEGDRISSNMEGLYLDQTLKSLAHDGTLPPSDCIQAYNLVGTYFYLRRRYGDGWAMGRKADEVIVRANLHITLSRPASAVALFRRPSASRYGVPLHLEALDAADEERSALCNMVYVDRGADILTSTPMCVHDGLDNEFRQLAVSSVLSHT